MPVCLGFGIRIRSASGMDSLSERNELAWRAEPGGSRSLLPWSELFYTVLVIRLGRGVYSVRNPNPSGGRGCGQSQHKEHGSRGSCATGWVGRRASDSDGDNGP